MAMTIIDTALYHNGALRLARHGADRGGNVLMHVATGQQVDISDEGAERLDAIVRSMSRAHSDRSLAIFQHVADQYPKQVRTSAY